MFRLPAHPNEVERHLYGGKHGRFRGRRYRRGKHRCRLCGAKLGAKNAGRFDHAKVRKALVENFFTPSPLWTWLQERKIA